MLAIKQGGITQPLYDSYKDVDYPVSFKEKCLCGFVTTQRCGCSDGCVSAYFYPRGLTKGTITHDAASNGFTSSVYYVVFGY